MEDRRDPTVSKRRRFGGAANGRTRALGEAVGSPRMVGSQGWADRRLGSAMWKWLASGAVALSVLVATAPSVAAAPPRQKYSEVFTTTRAGAPTGALLKVDWLGDRPGEKPHSIVDDVFSLAPGARFDFSVPAVCTASDADLEAAGGAACPKASEVAYGEVDLDQGQAANGFPRIVRTELTTFDGGPGKLISLAVTLNTGKPISTVDRSTVTGTDIVTQNPPLPGSSPPDPFVAVRSDRIHFLAISKGGHGFITTPRTCPASGTWTNRAVFQYHGGAAVRATSTSPCAHG